MGMYWKFVDLDAMEMPHSDNVRLSRKEKLGCGKVC